jgi:hypothetical protein
VNIDIALPAVDAKEIVIGKDILELLSGGMYQNPLDVYREYIQNSFDSMKLADITSRTFKTDVSISIDPKERTISIFDFGPGVSNKDFIRILTSIGNSSKRSPNLIGFRGVGRLGGLGYAKQIIMRSKSAEDVDTLEMVWDGVKLRNLLTDVEMKIDLQTLLTDIIKVKKVSAQDVPQSFFEVTMVGVVRLKNDALLNETEIHNYLSQVAPVPFHPDFELKNDIEAYFQQYNIHRGINIFLSNSEQYIYRPYRNSFNVSNEKKDGFKSVELFSLPGINDGVDAVGWILNHGYQGAIPKPNNIRGLRARIHNMQIGGEDIFEEVFPESRFNSWTVGEIHVLNRKIKPNGRRDNFEHNGALGNLLNHLSVHGREIGQTCRKSSQYRTRIRRINSIFESLEGNILLLSKDMLTGSHAELTQDIIAENISELEILLRRLDTQLDLFVQFSKRLREIKSQLSLYLSGNKTLAPSKKNLNVDEHKGYQDFIHGIIETMDDRGAALNLINKVLSRILN